MMSINCLSSQSNRQQYQKEPLALNPNFDWLKYAMSILIMMIHVGFSTEVIITRLAVPVFFMLSAYFFFKKLNTADKATCPDIYRKFLWRSIKLYVFWFVALLPVTVVARGWAEQQPLELTVNLLSGIVFKSTFLASWYISAYIIGITLAYMMRRFTALLLTIGAVCYAVCCLTSNYFAMIDGSWLTDLLGEYEPYNSFPVGLLFIGFGKILAERTENLNPWQAGLMLAVGTAMLFAENHMIESNQWRKADDCYFSAILCAPAIVILAKQLPPMLPNIKTGMLRKMSTINYCSHFSILYIVKYHLLPGESKGIYMAIVLGGCAALSFMLIYIANRPKLRWIRYCY